jgi:hypothetical protein
VLVRFSVCAKVTNGFKVTTILVRRVDQYEAQLSKCFRNKVAMLLKRSRCRNALENEAAML